MAAAFVSARRIIPDFLRASASGGRIAPGYADFVTDTGHATPLRHIPPSVLVDTLSDGTKVKQRVPRMRACDEKNAKGKLCAGHLKRWHDFGPEVTERFGRQAEIYRCEHCKTLYLPNPNEKPRTGTLAW